MVKHFSCYDVIKFSDLISKQITKASGDNLSISWLYLPYLIKLVLKYIFCATLFKTYNILQLLNKNQGFKINKKFKSLKV